MDTIIEAKPYVYKLTHKETGEFYFGMRYANKVPAIDDIGLKYKSSSKLVKLRGFDNFLIEIIAETDNNLLAYVLEQKLIEENFHDPLILNQCYKKRRQRAVFKKGLRASKKRGRKRRKKKRRKGERKYRFSKEDIAKLNEEIEI